jgi:hypothetical protein
MIKHIGPMILERVNVIWSTDIAYYGFKVSTPSIVVSSSP